MNLLLLFPLVTFEQLPCEHVFHFGANALDIYMYEWIS